MNPEKRSPQITGDEQVMLNVAMEVLKMARTDLGDLEEAAEGFLCQMFARLERPGKRDE
jgi:hypothetical protein